MDEEGSVAEVAPEAAVEDRDSFPRRYKADWSITGLQQEPTPSPAPNPANPCRRAVRPFTTAAITLVAVSATQGQAAVALSTRDQLNNYPGSNDVALGGAVSLRPGGAGTWTSGRTTFRVSGIDLGPPASMDVTIEAPWGARAGGLTCFSGTNVLRRRIGLTRVLPADDVERTFG